VRFGTDAVNWVLRGVIKEAKVWISTILANIYPEDPECRPPEQFGAACLSASPEMRTTMPQWTSCILPRAEFKHTSTMRLKSSSLHGIDARHIASVLPRAAPRANLKGGPTAASQRLEEMKETKAQMQMLQEDNAALRLEVAEHREQLRQQHELRAAALEEAQRKSQEAQMANAKVQKLQMLNEELQRARHIELTTMLKHMCADGSLRPTGESCKFSAGRLGGS